MFGMGKWILYVKGYPWLFYRKFDDWFVLN